MHYRPASLRLPGARAQATQVPWARTRHPAFMTKWANRSTVLFDEAANNVEVVRRCTTSTLDVLEPLDHFDLPGPFHSGLQNETSSLARRSVTLHLMTSREECSCKDTRHMVTANTAEAYQIKWHPAQSKSLR